MLVDNGSTINIFSHKCFLQIQEKGVKLTPLEEATFIIKVYDSSSKKLMEITTILITTGVKILATQF